MRMDIGLHPIGEIAIVALGGFESRIAWDQRLEIGGCEIGRDARDLALRKLQHAGLLDFREFVFDPPAHLFDAYLVHQDFHARFVDVVAAAAPAKGSAVMLRTQLPLVCRQCISTSASSTSMSGTSGSRAQWSCRFCRVVKWP